MKIWLIIILLVSSVIGFIFSYGYAYQKVSGVLLTTAPNTSPSFVAAK